MIAKIYIEGEIGYDTTLLDVMTQFKNHANPTSVEVYINSIGGSVKVGNDIYSYLANLPIPVTTIATMAYSIAASIFMAGETRIVASGADRLMIHFPFVMGFTGTSDELTDMSSQLKSLEKDMIKFYSGHLPDIDGATISNLLENETFISGDEAFTLGFATILEVPLHAVAYFGDTRPVKHINIDDNKKPIMTKFDELMQALKIFNGPEVKSYVVSLVVQDANGIDITFPNVAEDTTPILGDTATVDGQPADGEYLTPEGDKWVFSVGVLTELVPVEAEQPSDVPIVDTRPDPSTLTPEEINDILQELFAKATAEVETKLAAHYDAKLAEISEANKAEIVALKKLIGSPEEVETPVISGKQTKSNSLAQLLRA